jgi:hypothetical protein
MTRLSSENLPHRVDTPAVSVAERSDGTVSAHSPEERVHGGRLLRKEVPCAVMRSGSLRDFSVRLWLDCMDEIRELDGILDEEYWNVVANNVCVMLVSILSEVVLVEYILTEIAFVCVKSDGKTVHISDLGIVSLIPSLKSRRQRISLPYQLSHDCQQQY